MNTKLTTLLAAALLIAGCATTPAPTAVAPALDLASYHRVVVESVRIAPEAGMLSSANRQELERQLQYALVESIPSPMRAGTADSNVLRVQITVTALDAITPVNNGTTLLGVPLDRGSIAFEVRYYAPGATEPFATIEERHKAGRFAFSGSFSHYGHAVGAIRDWGTSLAGSLTRT